MSNWKIIYQRRQKNIKDIQLQLLTLKEQIEQIEQSKIVENDMKQNKVKQSKYFTNYFITKSRHTYLQNLIAMSTRLSLNSSQFQSHFQTQSKAFQENGVQGLSIVRAKIQACFSRRWRETIFTIYLVFHKYLTIEKKQKIRALILNDRGLILQVHSNIDTDKCFQTMSRCLKTFSSLSHVIAVAPQHSCINIDNIDILRDKLEGVKIVWVGYIQRESLTSKALNLQYQSFATNINNMRVTKYQYQNISLWHKQYIHPQLLKGFLLKLSLILRRQNKIKSFFKQQQYQTFQFNQRQFLLRLFSFCYNFVAIQALENQDYKIIMDRLAKNCISEVVDKNKQLEKYALEEVHGQSTNSIPLPCPICKKKSKNICIKCSQQFKTKFGLCDNACFQKFHENRPKYAQQLGSRRRVTDLSIQVQRQRFEENDDLNEDNSVSTRITHNYHNIRTMRQLRDKWQDQIEKERRNIDQYMQMCYRNFVERKIVDRINLLDNTIAKIDNSGCKEES